VTVNRVGPNEVRGKLSSCTHDMNSSTCCTLLLPWHMRACASVVEALREHDVHVQ
jgi:hypothetical protein